MKRRDFLKNMAIAGGAFALNNIPMRAMAKNSFLQQMAASSDNDRVLVIIQLHGGNDGLNTIVPIDQYTDYLDLRPNIALPFSGTSDRNIINIDPSLPIEDQIGIHPDMEDLRYLYDEGKVNIVQAVSYDNMNQSHFRSRDIWFMGGSYDDNLNSGWMGRYLTDKYPGYPDAYPNAEMLDPLALEIGNGISLAFHTPDTIPASLSIQDPESFFNLIDGVVGAPGITDGLDGSTATPPTEIETTKYADEIRWIMEFEKKSDQYAGRLRDVYLAGANSTNVNYPELYPYTAPSGSKDNPLSGQLKLISRLLSGGVKTKVFLARIGGFDTHALQVEPSSTTFGSHAANLYHIFSSIRAFQDDLKNLGLEDRVLTVTMSEFGRRAVSNNSWGTDHGKAAPMFVFGKHARAGVSGTNPDLKNLDGGNIPHQHDYRQVFNEVLEDWLCATDSEKEAVNFDQEEALPKLNVLDSDINPTNETFKNERYRLESCIPNPVEKETLFSYKINHPARVSLKIYNSTGILMETIIDEQQSPGEYSKSYDLSNLEKGVYTYTLKADSFIVTKRLLKQ